MTERESKMTLSADALDAVNMRQAVAVDELLNPDVPKANVVGVGSGVKWTNGQPTGEPAVVVMVTHKEAPDRLNEDDLIPSELAGMPTDVLQVGYLTAGVDLLMPGTSRLQTDSITISPPVTNGHAGAVEAPITGIGIELLTKRVRPAKGGYSVGNVAITAGTISTCVYDILPGGTISPPAPGVGIPSK